MSTHKADQWRKDHAEAIRLLVEAQAAWKLQQGVVS